MKRAIRLFVGIAWLPLAHAAVCNPNGFQGSYGFQLSGTTTISGNPQPVASVGRLVLDGAGGISGVSSVKFTGLLLGNPVTGMYEAKTDCSVSWSLQDDSGNFQHFQGTMTDDGKRITFRQSDPGGPQNGIMMRTGESCSAGDFRGRYSLNVSGSTIDSDTGLISGSVSIGGVIEADGQGNLSYAPDASSPFEDAGTFEVEDDCFVQLELELTSGDDDTAGWNFRAILVNGGRTVLGIDSDPGSEATLRLAAR